MKKAFQKEVQKEEPRPQFMAMIIVDPQNIAGVQFKPIEGVLELNELAMALGVLHDQCLVQFGAERERNQNEDSKGVDNG